MYELNQKRIICAELSMNLRKVNLKRAARIKETQKTLLEEDKKDCKKPFLYNSRKIIDLSII